MSHTSSRPLLIMLALVGASMLLPLGTSSAGEGELMDCREVNCAHRDECNRRVLSALNDFRLTYSEGEDNFAKLKWLTVQLERQERLRTFIAPACQQLAGQGSKTQGGPWSSIVDSVRRVFKEFSAQSDRPTAQATGAWSLPAFASKIDLDADGANWLTGLWQGWIHYYHSRSPVPIWIKIVLVDRKGGYIRACTDHGLVLGRVEKNGVLQLPRRETLDFGSRVLLWRSPPRYKDMDGVVLVEIEPGKWLDSGSASLTRVLTSAMAEGLAPPTDHACQSAEVLDRRNRAWNPLPPDQIPGDPSPDAVPEPR